MSEQKPSSNWFVKSKMLNWKDLSKGCVKGLLIGLNVLCVMIAIWTFSFAVVDMKILKQYGEQRASGSMNGDRVIIVLCVVLASIAVLGCVGTVLDKVKILYVVRIKRLYVICIMVLVVLELQVAIFVSVKRYGLQYRVSEWLQQDFYSNATRTDSELREHVRFWDALQSDYDCCGLNGPEDYGAIGRAISVSCCAKAYRAKTATAQRIMYRSCIETATYHTDGCEDELLDVLKEGAESFFAVIVVSFWFEAMCMFLAMWVANHVKNSVQVYRKTVKY